MPLNSAMWLMTGAENLLWMGLSVLFWRKSTRHRFPAMGYYVALRAISGPLLLILLYELSLSADRARYLFLYKVYTVAYFASYFASVVLFFFVCIEVLRSVLTPFPGIARLAVRAFPWVALAFITVNLSSALYSHKLLSAMGDAACSIERAVGVLGLCLLLFLCVSMKALRFGSSDLGFGISLGFGILSSGDFIMASWGSHIKSLSDPVEFVYEGLILLSLGIWGAYSLLPEPAPKPILVPASSTIYRWNEIASALGHGTRVAVQQPANGFFLSDVERVVEKVLAKNMKDRESET
jgi:hypothetical protein